MASADSMVREAHSTLKGKRRRVSNPHHTEVCILGRKTESAFRGLLLLFHYFNLNPIRSEVEILEHVAGVTFKRKSNV